MKTRMIGLMLGAAALSVWGAGCEQPTIDCRATRGSFATRFVLQNGSGTCSEIQTAIIGLQSYYAKGSDGQVDISKSTLAVRPESIVGPPHWGPASFGLPVERMARIASAR